VTGDAAGGHAGSEELGDAGESSKDGAANDGWTEGAHKKENLL
jgi:hypothetical protein